MEKELKCIIIFGNMEKIISNINEWIDKFVQRTKLNQKACIVCLKNTEVEWEVSEKDEIDLQNISHRFQSIFDKMEEERRLI